jgi:hypothetical protein
MPEAEILERIAQKQATRRGVIDDEDFQLG